MIDTLNKVQRMQLYLREKLNRSAANGDASKELAELHNETTLQFFNVMFYDELTEIEKERIAGNLKR